MADAGAAQVATTPEPALAALQELPLPNPVPYTPQTAGWWIVAALLLLLLAWGAWRWHKRRLANRYRVEALQELAEIERTLKQEPAAASRLPALVKRVALVSAPRADAAALSGESWLQWLERTLPHAGFLDAPGRLLPQLAYGSPQAADPQTLKALLVLVRRWIKEHHVHP
jgi:hypothetical protein